MAFRLSKRSSSHRPALKPTRRQRKMIAVAQRSRERQRIPNGGTKQRRRTEGRDRPATALREPSVAPCVSLSVFFVLSQFLRFLRLGSVTSVPSVFYQSSLTPNCTCRG